MLSPDMSDTLDTENTRDTVTDTCRKLTRGFKTGKEQLQPHLRCLQER